MAKYEGRSRQNLGPMGTGELGANMILSLALVGGFLAIVPFFLDATSVNFSYRVAQTGADSAAHAAAVEYARTAGSIDLDELIYVPPLSGRFTVTCTDDASGGPSAQVYLDKVWIPSANGFLGNYIGRESASRYAGAHQASLSRYVQRVEPWRGGGREVAGGVSVFPIRILVAVDRPTNLMFGGFYGSELRQEADGAAEVFPAQASAARTTVEGFEECPGAAAWLGTPDGERTESEGQVPVLYDWTFTLEWGVRLLGRNQ